MKTLTAGMATHLTQTTTTLAACWKIKRTDGTLFAFTAHDEDLQVDLADGDGLLTYKASSAFNRTSVSNKDDLSVDELNITGGFDSADIDEDDLKKGLFDHAEAWMFMVNWENLADGVIPLRKGRLGEVTLTSQGLFFAELRGLTQAFSRRSGELYWPICGVDLGSPKCAIPLRPPLISRNQAVTVGQFFRVRNPPDPLAAGLVGVVNGDFETDTPPATNAITGWTVIAGDTWDIRTANPFEGSQNAHVSGTQPGRLRQDIELRSSQGGNVADASLAVEDRVSITASVWVSEPGNDRMQLEIAALDSADVVLETLTSPIDEGSVYSQIQLTKTLPVNTAKLRVDLIGGRIGPTIDADFDLVEATWVDTAIIPEEIPSTLFNDRIFVVTIAGTTAAGPQPTYDQVIGNSTVDGTATLVAEDSWARAIEVTAVDGLDPRKKFTVTELTPNAAGPRGGFPDTWFELGAVVWETGANVGLGKEVRDYIPDDGVTITQDIELFEKMPNNIAIGDKARIYPGCDLSFATCRDKFDNVLNFRGFPFLPGQDTILKYPDAKS